MNQEVTAFIENINQPWQGPPERKWIKIREGQSTDYEMLAKLIVQASSSL